MFIRRNSEKSHGLSSLRRSNSWSGDTRWKRQIARHSFDHLRYDPDGQCYRVDLAQAGKSVVVAETEALMEMYGVPNEFPRLVDARQQEQISQLEEQLRRLRLNVERDGFELAKLAKRHGRGSSSELDDLRKKLDEEKRTIERLAKQNELLKAGQRNTLDKKVHEAAWRIRAWFARLSWHYPFLLLLITSLLVFVVCIADPTFRSLVFEVRPSEPLRFSGPRHCLARPDAKVVIEAQGLVLPHWLQPGWLEPSSLSFHVSCPPHYPIVLRASQAANAEKFLAWLTGNRTAAKCMKNLVLAQGAVLLRGVPELDDTDFERTMSLLDIPPTAYTGSIGRRETVTKESKRTFTTKYPPSMILMPHIEFGNKQSRPEFIAFFAQQLPESYGETPLVDFQSIWENMRPQLKLRFAEGIRFTTRLYPDYFRWFWGDYASTWKGAFSTSDPEAALQQCRLMGGVRSCTWKYDGSLEYITEFPAVHFHKMHGGAAVLSTTFGFWNAELPLFSLARFAHRLTFAERIYAYFFMRFKFGSTYFDPTPTRATFIDGSQLTVAESKELSDMIWDNSVIFPSERADMTILDNTGIGHGRMNVGGSIEQRKVVSFIGGEFRVPEKVFARLDVFAQDAQLSSNVVV